MINKEKKSEYVHISSDIVIKYNYRILVIKSDLSNIVIKYSY